MLKGIPTFERLTTDWPEGRKFDHSLPADFPYQHTVPAVEIKKLNEILGLVA